MTPTPHLVTRVLAVDAAGLRLAVRCTRCGTAGSYTAPELPGGMEMYAVRVVGEAGLDPLTGQPLPGFEEEFTTIGSSRQDAYERSLFGRETRAAGQFVRTYLDGVEHRDERW